MSTVEAETAVDCGVVSKHTVALLTICWFAQLTVVCLDGCDCFVCDVR